MDMSVYVLLLLLSAGVSGWVLVVPDEALGDY